MNHTCTRVTENNEKLENRRYWASFSGAHETQLKEGIPAYLKKKKTERNVVPLGDVEVAH